MHASVQQLYTWLLSSLYQKGECFKDWQVMVGPSQTPLGGAATIESAVRSVLSPRLAHKTGLNRQKIITFLSHFVDKATKQPTKQAGYYCIAVTFLLPTKTAERLQARDCCHAVTFLLPHRTHIFPFDTFTHILLTPLDGPPSNSTFLLAPLFSFLPSYPTSSLGH